jgi:hypothetical protein
VAITKNEYLPHLDMQVLRNVCEIFSMLSRMGSTTEGNLSLRPLTLATRTLVLRETQLLVRRILSGGKAGILSKDMVSLFVKRTAPPKQLVVLSNPEGVP